MPTLPQASAPTTVPATALAALRAVKRPARLPGGLGPWGAAAGVGAGWGALVVTLATGLWTPAVQAQPAAPYTPSVLATANAANGHGALPSLENLPRPAAPPLERAPVLPMQVERWRVEAKSLEYGEGVERDPVRAAELYCRAARHGDAEAQFNLAWMLTNARGIERDEAQAAHLFQAAAEQGYAQAQNILGRMGRPQGPPPACLRPPEDDRLLAAATPVNLQPQGVAYATGSKPGAKAAGPVANPAASNPLVPPWAPPPPAHAPEPIVRFVQLVAPEYQLQPHVVLAFIAVESNFDPNAQSPKNAMGLMQLIPETAARFGVKNPKDPVQNLRGGMAYLRWLLARFEGDLTLAAAAYNAGEGAVERYLGVPPYAETRLYVRKIRAAAGGQLTAPFDAAASKASDLLPLLKSAWRPR